MLNFEFDESCKKCDCESGIIFEELEKKTLCSMCGLVFVDHSEAAKPTSSDGFFNPTIKAFCDRSLLPETVRSIADMNFKRVKNDPSMIEQKGYDSICAACIYVACRQENCTEVSISEICYAVNRVKPANMLKAIGILAEKLEFDETLLLKNLKTSDYIDWFCAALNMESFEVKAAQEVARTSECVNSPRSAYVVPAMVVRLVSLFSVKKMPLKDFEEVTGVEENTMKQTYEELNTDLAKIAEECYAIAKGKK